mgnify:FL=1
MGINRPYPLEGGVDNEERSASRKRADNRVQEFVWAFGAESEEQIEKQIKLQIEQLKKTKDIEEIMHGRWAHMDEFDQDEWLEHLEEHLKRNRQHIRKGCAHACGRYRDAPSRGA